MSLSEFPAEVPNALDCICDLLSDLLTRLICMRCAGLLCEAIEDASDVPRDATPMCCEFSTHSCSSPHQLITASYDRISLAYMQTSAAPIERLDVCTSRVARDVAMASRSHRPPSKLIKQFVEDNDGLARSAHLQTLCVPSTPCPGHSVLRLQARIGRKLHTVSAQPYIPLADAVLLILRCSHSSDVCSKAAAKAVLEVFDKPAFRRSDLAGMPTQALGGKDKVDVILDLIADEQRTGDFKIDDTDEFTTLANLRRACSAVSGLLLDTSDTPNAATATKK